MKVKIIGDTIRKSGSVLRFQIEAPGLTTGRHGVQVDLPTTVAKVKAAIKVKYEELDRDLKDDANIRLQFAGILDKELILK